MGLTRKINDKLALSLNIVGLLIYPSMSNCIISSVLKHPNQGFSAVRPCLVLLSSGIISLFPKIPSARGGGSVNTGRHWTSTNPLTR